MSSVFEFTTDRSRWTFDFDSMIMSRMPRADEGSFTEHEGLKYSSVGKPVPFIWAKPFVWPDGLISIRFYLGDHVRISGTIVDSWGEIPENHLKEFERE